ncbi:MAG: histone deacetylase [Spirochaetales bacterium]
MIVYSSESTVRHSDYGILIPIYRNKAEQIYTALQKDCMQGIPKTAWVHKPSGTSLAKEDVLRVHTEAFVERLFSDFPDQELIKTFELIREDGSYNRYDPNKALKPLSSLAHEIFTGVQAGCEAGEIALKTGFTYFLGGGMHHAMADSGSGFCLVNDVVITARYLQAKKLIKTVWIIDLDAHKGDGTAALTKDDKSIITLSIHMAKGWPLDEPEYYPDGTYNTSWTPSDIDIGIQRGEENLYADKLKEALSKLETVGNNPDLAVIVDGSDPYEKDELESTKDLQLTKEMLAHRSMLVYNFLKQKNIPMLYFMAGGYGKDSWEIHTDFLSTVLPSIL